MADQKTKKKIIAMPHFIFDEDIEQFGSEVCKQNRH